jgi:ABC-2 type transport system permease protein
VVVIFGGGNAIELLLGPLPFVQAWVLMTYIFVTSSLWFAPVIGWFLLCSAFAKRSVLIWVALPPIVLGIFEAIVFRGTTIWQIIGTRFREASVSGLQLPAGIVDDEEALKALVLGGNIDLLAAIAPGQFLLSPGLWGGFAVAALFGAAAVYCRRFRS